MINIRQIQRHSTIRPLPSHCHVVQATLVSQVLLSFKTLVKWDHEDIEAECLQNARFKIMCQLDC